VAYRITSRALQIDPAAVRALLQWPMTAPTGPGASEVRTSPHSRRLSTLVGRWRSEGFLVADPDVRIRGTDAYELLPGGHFLVHHVDVVVGDRPVVAIEIIGEYDEASDSFAARSYDNDGNVTVMQARDEEAGVWHFLGGADIAPAAQRGAEPPGAVRSTLTIDPDGLRMHADWELADEPGEWRPWMDMTFKAGRLSRSARWPAGGAGLLHDGRDLLLPKRPRYPSSRGNVIGSPNASNNAYPKVVISAISAPSTRRTSSLNARNSASPGRRR
jgi:hypothetical protein